MQARLYDAAGREQSGWPVTLVGDFWSENLAVGTDGVAYTACRIDDEQVLLNAVDVGGATLPGWPIRATGYPLRVGVGRDGTVYFGTVNEAGDGILSIHAFGPNGHPEGRLAHHAPQNGRLRDCARRDGRRLVVRGPAFEARSTSSLRARSSR